MKLKYQFVLRNVSGKTVAVAVGKDNEHFNGMIKLNSSGELIFRLLSENGISQDELLSRFSQQFGIPRETAEPAVTAFLDSLRTNGLLDE